jgi:hypothetical protein
MPGYRSLPDALSGAAADLVRDAYRLEQEGEHASAMHLYLQAITESLKERPEMPSFVCGRLAAVYRRLERYQDEVDLLESFRDTQTQEDSRARFDARLSKARAIADKHERSDSGALNSVREVKRSSALRPRRNRSRLREDLPEGTNGQSHGDELTS